MSTLRSVGVLHSILSRPGRQFAKTLIVGQGPLSYLGIGQGIGVTTTPTYMDRILPFEESNTGSITLPS